MMKPFETFCLSALVLLILGSAACQSAPAIVTKSSAASEEPPTTTFTSDITAEVTSPPAPTDEYPAKINFDEDIPEWGQELILNIPEIKEILDSLPESIDIGFIETPYLIGELQYFLVTPFKTPITSLSLNEFNYIWSINNQGAEPTKTILISEESEKVLVHRWGNHQDGIKVLPHSEEELIESLFSESEPFLAVIPAQFLSSDMRTVRLDNKSFFQTGESLARNIFSVKLYSSAPLVKKLVTLNFSPEALATVNITGVTALVRATAVLMRINGSHYPAEKILSILTEADYTHMSNEVSFSPFCPVQEYNSDNLIFCSPEKTFELLDYIDIDIVDLSGDHLLDYGPDAFLHTLELYKEAGMVVYGGGENLIAAQQALKIEHNGNKFAFLGCNAKNPSYSKAAINYPGTWHCDLETLKQLVLPLQADGYTPIITIQHLENELNTPPAQIIEDFNVLSELKPIILIGTQAHVSKPMKTEEDIFIHYGLGNLFFDQINESESHSEAFIDRLVFYNNSLLNIELFPIKFLDYAQSRPMTSAEETIFLTKIFELSEFTHP